MLRSRPQLIMSMEIKINFNILRSLILGHIATSLWFIPKLALLLHSLRGVKFKKIETVFLGRDVIIDNRYPSLIEIGEDVWITSNCIILAHSYFSKVQNQKYGTQEKVGQVKIGDGAFIGVGSIVCPGVSIGIGSYIAAGSVVTKNTNNFCLYAGNPAKFIKELSNEENN